MRCFEEVLNVVWFSSIQTSRPKSYCCEFLLPSRIQIKAYFNVQKLQNPRKIKKKPQKQTKEEVSAWITVYQRTMIMKNIYYKQPVTEIKLRKSS